MYRFRGMRMNSLLSILFTLNLVTYAVFARNTNHNKFQGQVRAPDYVSLRNGERIEKRVLPTGELQTTYVGTGRLRTIRISRAHFLKNINPGTGEGFLHAVHLAGEAKSARSACAVRGLGPDSGTSDSNSVTCSYTKNSLSSTVLKGLYLHPSIIELEPIKILKPLWTKP